MRYTHIVLVVVFAFSGVSCTKKQRKKIKRVLARLEQVQVPQRPGPQPGRPVCRPQPPVCPPPVICEEIPEGAITVEGISWSASVDHPDFSGDEAKGIFEIEIEVTAHSSDVYIVDEVEEFGNDVAGFTYRITGGAFVGHIADFVAETSADEEDDEFVVNRQSSETFTIRVELDPEMWAEGGAFGVELTEIRFNLGGGKTYIYEIPDSPEFETSLRTID